jgi:hypothetical protein
MVFSGNKFDVKNSANAVTEDSYSESNQDGAVSLNNTVTRVAQTFVGAGGTLSNCHLYLKKVGSPTGTALVKVYSVTGTPGSGATPNAVLATSQTINVANLGWVYHLVKLIFTGATNQITLVNTTDYFVSIEYTNGDASNYVDVGVDTTSIEANTNLATYSGSWSADNAKEACYYVRTGGIVIVNATDSDPATFINTGSPEGIVDIRNSVTVTVRKVRTQLEGQSKYVQVRVEESDGTLISQGDASTVDDKNAGYYKYTFNYNYTGEQAVNIIVRYFDYYVGATFLPKTLTGTITTLGLDVTVSWDKDGTQ